MKIEIDTGGFEKSRKTLDDLAKKIGILRKEAIPAKIMIAQGETELTAKVNSISFPLVTTQIFSVELRALGITEPIMTVPFPRSDQFDKLPEDYKEKLEIAGAAAGISALGLHNMIQVILMRDEGPSSKDIFDSAQAVAEFNKSVKKAIKGKPDKIPVPKTYKRN